MNRWLRFTFLSLPLAVLLALCASGPLAAELRPKTGDARLSGKIVGADGESLSGATLIAYHLESESTFRSEPTHGDGAYEISGLPFGYFDLAVESSAGLYVADLVVNVAPSSKTVVVLDLSAGGPDPALRDFPGSNATPVGVASVREKVRGRDFWRSAKGISIFAGAGGVALLAIAAGGSDDPFASPSAP